MEKEFNTAVLVNVQDCNNTGAVTRVALETISCEVFTLPLEIVHALVLNYGVEQNSISIYSMTEFMDMYNNDEIACANNFIGFTNLKEEME